MPLFYLFQGINVLVIDTAVQGAVKGPDHHDFRALPVVYLHSPGGPASGNGHARTGYSAHSLPCVRLIQQESD